MPRDFKQERGYRSDMGTALTPPPLDPLRPKIVERVAEFIQFPR
jgi:hypothetical protein